jgi:hypothetical protein
MLIDSLKLLISKGTNSQEENNMFITLMRVAQEDKKIKDQIMTIVNLEPVHRKKTVDLLVVYLKNRNAPEEFIEAILSLEKESVVDQIKEVL